jgi:hypothetical protein
VCVCVCVCVCDKPILQAGAWVLARLDADKEGRHGQVKKRQGGHDTQDYQGSCRAALQPTHVHASAPSVGAGCVRLRPQRGPVQRPGGHTKPLAVLPIRSSIQPVSVVHAKMDTSISSTCAWVPDWSAHLQRRAHTHTHTHTHARVCVTKEGTHRIGDAGHGGRRRRERLRAAVACGRGAAARRARRHARQQRRHGASQQAKPKSRDRP